MDVSTWGQLTFFCVFGQFWHGAKQPGDPRASRLLSSEKAVYCKRETEEQGPNISRETFLKRSCRET